MTACRLQGATPDLSRPEARAGILAARGSRGGHMGGSDHRPPVRAPPSLACVSDPPAHPPRSSALRSTRYPWVLPDLPSYAAASPEAHNAPSSRRDARWRWRSRTRTPYDRTIPPTRRFTRISFRCSPTPSSAVCKRTWGRNFTISSSAHWRPAPSSREGGPGGGGGGGAAPPLLR